MRSRRPSATQLIFPNDGTPAPTQLLSRGARTGCQQQKQPSAGGEAYLTQVGHTALFRQRTTPRSCLA